MSNFFDQFDTPTQTSKNVFDQFDPPPTVLGTASDAAKSLGAGGVALSPLALGAVFLLGHAVAIRSRPQAKTAPPRKIGGWTRLALVLTFLWSAVVYAFVRVVGMHGDGALTTAAALTYAPLAVLWLLFGAIAWVRMGFRRD